MRQLEIKGPDFRLFDASQLRVRELVIKRQGRTEEIQLFSSVCRSVFLLHWFRGSVVVAAEEEEEEERAEAEGAAGGLSSSYWEQSN